jgi:hypothetical protein
MNPFLPVLPEGTFLMSWEHLKILAALCFILGFCFNALLEKFKKQYIEKQDQKGIIYKS